MASKADYRDDRAALAAIFMTSTSYTILQGCSRCCCILHSRKRNPAQAQEGPGPHQLARPCGSFFRSTANTFQCLAYLHMDAQ